MDAKTPNPDGRGAAKAARRAAILEAAKAVFFEEGYQLASMDRVAERAGVTKRTVYDHFTSKEGLFGAVVDHGCASVVAALPDLDTLPADPRQGLAQFAHVSAALMASPNCIRLERLVLAEADRHPAFARTLGQAIEAGEAKLARYLAACTAAGRLKPHDPAVAARMLSNAIGHATSLRGLIATEAAPGEREKATAAIDEAVALYLAAYGAP
jgi:TetR/AcrR family transcriptional repressor of mexJK operon